MADNVAKSMESLSLHRQQAGYPSNNGNGPSPSMRTTSSNYGSGNYDPQSASARFERFFNNSSHNPSGSPTLVDQQLSPSYQSQPPASFGPSSSSSAAGLASNGAFGSFGHSFGAGGGSGAFNHGGPNNSTVPALRTKTSNIRQAIPSQWSTTGNDDLALGGSSPPGAYGAAHSQYFTMGPSSGFSGQGVGAGVLGDDDIIPTAIVVKNIPFSIKKEQLLQIIEDLQIPMPYAFNYHFDQGVFRGLAFANFRSGEEADAVVAALNGFDVSGRKLRVEYKKVLQAGEKERIEKEKAIKRMQSMQIEKERERMRRQTVSGAGDEWIASLPARPNEGDSGYVDYASGDTAGVGQSSLAVPEPTIDAVPSSASDAGSKKEELDLNDPATLEIYSRVLLFKDDRMRDELSFSKNLTTSERRIVHMVSKKLALYHYSLGDGEERHVVVTKNEVNQGQKSLRSQASTIGRSNRGEGNMASGNGLLQPGSSHTTGRSGLRTKKSAPDMKRPRERVDDGGFGGLSSNFVFGASGSSNSNNNSVNSSYYASNPGLSRKSNGNLREGYSATMGRRPQPGGVGGAAGLQSLFSSPFDVPPVPSLPVIASDAPTKGHGHSPMPSPIGGGGSTNGSLSAATSQHILRQPAGPGGSNRNFAQRSRVPLINVGTPDSSNVDDGDSAAPAHNGSQDLDDRFGTLGTLNDDDVRTHEPLEV